MGELLVFIELIHGHSMLNIHFIKTICLNPVDDVLNRQKNLATIEDTERVRLIEEIEILLD